MEIYHNKELSLQPLISAYTIIGRNVRLLEQWLKCVRERSGMKPFEYEIDLVLWDPADDILQYVNDNEIRHTVYDSSKHEYNGHPDHRFVFDLYNCWKIGTEMSRATYVLRSGSDQLFSKEFLSNSMDLILNYEYELTDEGFKPREQFCTAFYHLYTLESWNGSKTAYGRPCSRHIMPLHWHRTHFDFDWGRFDKFCDAMSYPVLLNASEYPLMLHHGARGWIPHCVGASWIQRKDTHYKTGPMINYVKHGGVTGDIDLFDKGDALRIPSLLIHNAFTFHIGKAELSEIT